MKEKNSDVCAFVLAHQDDDVFISSKIRQIYQEGKKVILIWLTGVQKREKEAREAMKLIGVPESNLYFLGYKCFDSHNHVREIVEKISIIFRKEKPKEVYTLAYEGGHIDHDIANFVSV